MKRSEARLHLLSVNVKYKFDPATLIGLWGVCRGDFGKVLQVFKNFLDSVPGLMESLTETRRLKRPLEESAATSRPKRAKRSPPPTVNTFTGRPEDINMATPTAAQLRDFEILDIDFDGLPLPLPSVPFSVGPPLRWSSQHGFESRIRWSDVTSVYIAPDVII